ncbi:restriction endonuclease subunit S [Shewanella algae]
MAKWKSQQLSNLASITMGSSPKSTAYNDEGIGLPLIQGNADIKNRLTKPRTYTSQITKECTPGSIIMTVRAPVGAIAKSTVKGCIGRGVCAISATKISQDYLYQYLISQESKWKKLEQGSTFSAIGSKDVKQLSIAYPESVKEQAQIAEVLSTVDKKIDLIDQKIAETEKLKTGLMQKLFSEGVGVQDENGNWQPHTEFQDSPFGKIPQPWSTLELAEIADIEDGDRGKSYPKQADFSDFGYCLFLSAKNVTKQGFTYETTQFISQEKHNKLRKGQVLQNDIVLTTRGTVGNFGLFKHEELFDAVRINSGMAIIRCIDSSMPNYLYQFMQSPQFKAQISKVVFGSAQPQLTIKQIKKFKVLVPISEEKKWIEETLKLANDKLTLLEQQKAETQQLKKGLMQKLLTGEWRVPVEETEAA